ncbi:MAG TPA: DNA repair protein RadA [Geminicoccus sp.]|uniref:DNA repair protein RadA n=1 Tax=Geminicoccus sp. TaxID=2024832 RepID=UPI002CE5F978|nr:DNA repair protein RadA [Geminicoccus sp.]HWL71249.1 DNA repair protein RadA [Geminicoccus sp.]
MARIERRFVCQSCGAVTSRWHGRCDDCGAWDSFVEETVQPKGTGSAAATRTRGRRVELVGLSGAATAPPRIGSGIDELDRALGGGLVPASALLIGGDPGIGKSTLVLQAGAGLARAGRRVVYVTGEESIDQVRLRAHRLGVTDSKMELAAENAVADILTTLAAGPAPDLLIVDSIQTMFTQGFDQAPGTVTQLRASTDALIRFAKTRQTAVLLVGHVTKEGQIAGPRVLEHMVDTVLYFEGERGHQFRILRAVKNRFGPANEIGVFEMQEAGLVPVTNPSALFLSEREEGLAGSAVYAGIEGSRPVLLEIQALVGNVAPGSPRRAVVGWDNNRLAMLLAVLEARCGLELSGRDVYLNVAGGLRIAEPAADMAVAAALIGSLLDRPGPEKAVFFGEVGLGGEVRSVTQSELRIREAAKLGFTEVVAPPGAAGKATPVAVTPIRRVGDLVAMFSPAAVPGRRPRVRTGVD